MTASSTSGAGRTRNCGTSSRSCGPSATPNAWVLVTAAPEVGLPGVMEGPSRAAARGGAMFAVVDGRETYYRAGGTGEPLLLLHGWGASSESLAGRVAQLELPPFQLREVFAPDTPCADMNSL